MLGWGVCGGKKVKDFLDFPVVKIWNSHSQWFSLARGNLALFGEFFDRPHWERERGHPGIWWVGTRDAAEGTGWPDTAKSDLAPNTNSEKPGSRCSGNSKRLTGL